MTMCSVVRDGLPGNVMVMAKAVVDAAVGGMILMSDASHRMVYIEDGKDRFMVSLELGYLKPLIEGLGRVCKGFGRVGKGLRRAGKVQGREEVKRTLSGYTLPHFLHIKRQRCTLQVLHMGEHRLPSPNTSLTLYQPIDRSLAGRLPMLGSVRTSQQMSLGVLEAPAGMVTIVFM